MRYFAKYNENNNLIAIGTGYGGTEISEAEYNRLLAEIHEKANFVEQLYNGEITVDTVPSEWQEEIQLRVEKRREMDELIAEEEASEADYLNALNRLGVSE